MTVAIAFNGGAYGTYLEWCLTIITNAQDICSPFTKVGSSHQFAGIHLNNMDGWTNYINSGQNHPLVRLHPKTQKTESLSSNLDYICNTAKSVVYLYPDPDSVLLCINNYMTKVWSDWWSKQLSHFIDINLIYQNWPVAANTSVDQIPTWVKREFLSFYLMPAWFDQVEWNHLTRWSNPKACIVTIQELLFNFEDTIKKVSQHCSLNLVRPISDLLPYHQQNLELQLHLDQDQLCKNIIDSTVAGSNFEWNVLPLASEAWIQWQLRNLGLEIQCDGLDIFPTNSVHLKELLYSV
jgi:hypothetical protein